MSVSIPIVPIVYTLLVSLKFAGKRQLGLVLYCSRYNGVTQGISFQHNFRDTQFFAYNFFQSTSQKIFFICITFQDIQFTCIKLIGGYFLA